MKRSLMVVAVAMLLLESAGNAFAQGGSAQLGGIAQDTSKALIPGASVTAKNSGDGRQNGDPGHQ